MALEDIKAPGRHGANIYRIIHRFLQANIGKPWASVYSRLCAVADSRTYKGEEIRRCIGYEVDMNGFRTKRWRNDLFVDDSGILRKFKQDPWKTSWDRARKNAPITEIFFAKDGPDLWYELTEIPDGPRASKYTKMHTTWFKVVRTVEMHTTPLREDEIQRAKIGLIQARQGKKNWYRESQTETYHKTSVGRKPLHILLAVGLHVNLPEHKILRLEYHWNHAEDKHTMTAYVSGSSQ